MNPPNLAPLIIIAVNASKDHPKIPKIEQLHPTAASTQNIINAAWALGLGAIWRTGDSAHNPLVAEAIGLADNEQIVGFVYVGHKNQNPEPLSEPGIGQYLTALIL